MTLKIFFLRLYVQIGLFSVRKIEKFGKGKGHWIAYFIQGLLTIPQDSIV